MNLKLSVSTSRASASNMTTSPVDTPVIAPAIRADIMARLANTERNEGVRILLAVESGSRAWGFHSPNSDYDVRFIYMRSPDWYLAVDMEERRDVIEYPIVDDIDLNGWDVRKALRLFWKSNPALIEWIQSPIIYMERGGFAAGTRTLLDQVYSVERGLYHYRSMAKTNFLTHLRADMVPMKKYFYVLRPLLAVRWLERYGRAAPIELGKLLHLIDDQPQLTDAIAELLAKKRNAPEMGLAEPVALLHGFIEEELARHAASTPLPDDRKTPLPQLNALFHAVLQEADCPTLALT